VPFLDRSAIQKKSDFHQHKIKLYQARISKSVLGVIWDERKGRILVCVRKGCAATSGVQFPPSKGKEGTSNSLVTLV
jgi:hypothetical protein